MTIGRDTGQLGNALPLSGGGVIQQGSSSVDALTITMNSSVTSTASNALRVQRTAEAGSSGGAELFVAEYDGVRGLRHIIALSSAAASGTQYLTPDMYGAFCILPAVTTTGSSNQTWTLPPAEQGGFFEIYAPAALATGIVVFKAPSCGGMVVFDDSAADSFSLGKATGVEIIGGSVRFHSDGSQWVVIPQPAFTSAAPTSATMTPFSIQT